MPERLDLYKIRDAVLELDSADRENLRALLDRDEQRVSIIASREEQELWDVLTRLTPTGSRRFRSFSEFVRDKRSGVNRTAYNEALDMMLELVAEAQPVRRPTHDRMALIELVIGCLSRDLQRRNVEINPRTLIEAMPRLRTAVEHSFPGYVGSKMLHRLIRIAEPA